MEVLVNDSGESQISEQVHVLNIAYLVHTVGALGLVAHGSECLSKQGLVWCVCLEIVVEW